MNDFDILLDMLEIPPEIFFPIGFDLFCSPLLYVFIFEIEVLPFLEVSDLFLADLTLLEPFLTFLSTRDGIALLLSSSSSFYPFLPPPVPFPLCKNFLSSADGPAASTLLGSSFPDSN